MIISEIAKKNEPQLVRTIYQKARDYKGVIDLTLVNAALENA